MLLTDCLYMEYKLATFLRINTNLHSVNDSRKIFSLYTSTYGMYILYNFNERNANMNINNKCPKCGSEMQDLRH